MQLKAWRWRENGPDAWAAAVGPMVSQITKYELSGAPIYFVSTSLNGVDTKGFGEDRPTFDSLHKAKCYSRDWAEYEAKKIYDSMFV